MAAANFARDGLEEQKQIDDFILTTDCHRSPEIQKYLFRKLYDQKGQDDEVREILDAAFDFSKQKNCCAAMKIGEYLCCGEPCEGMFCNKHLLQMEGLGIIPGPCKCCGIGIGIDKRSTYCSPCVLETGGRERSRSLAKEFEDEEPPVFGEKKRCQWLKKGHSGHCGEKCKDGPFWNKHLQKIAGGRSLRFPCIVCLAGIKDSAVCASCSLEQEVIEFEKDDAAVGTYWWHYKKQQ